MCTERKLSWVVPYGGNGFITASEFGSTDEVSDCGILNWESTSTVFSLYFHVEIPGRYYTALLLRVAQGSSTIDFSMVHNTTKKVLTNKCGQGQPKDLIIISGPETYLVNCGLVTIDQAGYVRVDLQGVNKIGANFAEVSHLVLVSESEVQMEDTFLRFVRSPDDFYFGRRGPSVHLQFEEPPETDCEYFYNEITVPRFQDIVGTYYMAVGFSGGYFGIQVNSEEERRVLFSVWSEYDSDDPGQVPEEYRVKLIRKGDDVYDGEFGNEGVGAQSYWNFMWQPETTYKFIVHGRPIDSERTMFTAWFNSGTDWKLIASFDKPKVSIFLKDFYSFSENFVPEQGHLERHCLFGNQWVRGADASWTELTHARFTADDGARREIRMDIAGGVGIDGEDRRFYLRNCGFFSDRVEVDTEFDRVVTGSGPPVDVSILP